ncbi:ABC transporter ATP-binding protein [Nitzschia inconspicua]|uniref:ABC transporter ATP-binding protein n=1 Tax=Nitzschia inconspicua TaxID=303405 RepID=A0A9K3LJ43_9STRA|nr:ABC transporter ATP-binding protein [Nitzschia inconspicua]
MRDFSSMWSVDFLVDPLESRHRYHHSSGITNGSKTASFLVTACIPLKDFFGDIHQTSYQEVQQAGGRAAQVAIADFCARYFVRQECKELKEIDNNFRSVSLETLDQALLYSKRRQRYQNGSKVCPPYVVERSDFYCQDDNLNLILRINCCTNHGTPNLQDVKDTCTIPCQQLLFKIFSRDSLIPELLHHIACIVLQQRIRQQLMTMEAVAFLGNGSILPRKSGKSHAPMASPPAVPFQAPKDSRMSQSISIDMGPLAKYLAKSTTPSLQVNNHNRVTLSGLVVPGGITLICGGGYHGKSTTLQAIAMGVYDKIPGDGREWCVSVSSAVTVRAEDGRYVNNCNISAFISNLPTPPGVTKAMDTKHFSSEDASGSTSQAANVVEAMEMGATAMLVDEDISAANFMARDGRMRALVMDESITPLLYRVNSLYQTHKISSVVVVGGVGDWLDVPHNVLLLDKYVAYDATKKAQSISYQFSYGHVQYAGRGVVHRLEWDRSGTPIPRRPVDSFAQQYGSDVSVSILDGGHVLSLHRDNDDSDSDAMQVIDDDEEGCADASRIQQFLSRKQLYASGVCVAWLLQRAPNNPHAGLQSLLQQLDDLLDNGGINQILQDLREERNGSKHSKAWIHTLETVGYLERPRIFEIGQVLTRLHGIKMEEIQVEDDGQEEAARLEEERKKKALAELWAKRKSKSIE